MATVTICKFVGTISLGLLTGQSLTLNLTLLPTLSTLPTSPSAQKPYTHLVALTRRQTALLSSLSASAFLLAYTFSPSRLRHPYLLYATLAIAGGWSSEARDYLLGRSQHKNDGTSPAVSGSLKGKNVVSGESSGDEEWEVETAGAEKSATGSQFLNGEVVRDGMERWRKRMGIKAGVWGAGWVLAVVGLWGDGV